MMQKDNADLTAKKKELEIRVEGLRKTSELQIGMHGSILVHA